MQPCLRSTKARIFQQIVRLRRRTDATATLLLHGAGPVGPRTNRRFASTAERTQAVTAAYSDHHVRRGLPLRQQYYSPKIQLPRTSADIETWILVLERALFRRSKEIQSSKDPSFEGRDLAFYLIDAYRSRERHLDLLSHLGLQQGKWQTVMDIIKLLIKDGNASEIRINTPTSMPLLQWQISGTLHDLTTAPFDIERAALKLETPTLTSFADYIQRVPDLGWTNYKGALGLVWRALGSMTLAASRSDAATRAGIMPHVLEIIALLHKHDIIPHAVYQPPRTSEPLTLQQPPTLHLLSNQILTAISDAEWRASEGSNAIRSKATGSQYDMFGNEMTGTAYRSHVQQLRPEIWLELILWSCLHGGWVEEGASTLQSLQAKENGEWSLINWKNELIQALDTSASKELSFSSFFRRASTKDKRDVEKTLSSELVVAYVDALVTKVRVGVGERGMAMSQVLASIKVLKEMLDKNDFGLGTASWDSIIVRLLESEGINIDENPTLLGQLLELSQPFAREIQLENTSGARDQGGPTAPYVFDASTATLGLYHQLIRICIKQGNPKGALNAFRQLQDFTDLNKYSSVEEFFKSVKSSAEANTSQFYGLAATRGANVSDGFTSNISQLADSYPNFYPQLPKTLIAPLLDQCTQAGALDFAKWLLYSEDADGPAIPESVSNDPAMFPSLIRYATAAGDKKLLRQVISNQSSQPRPDGEVLITFLESQIALHRWDSVEAILRQARDPGDYSWKPTTVAVLACEMLRLERNEADGDDTSRQRAREIFANLTSDRYGPPASGEGNAQLRIDSILGYLSSLGADWFLYCAPLRPVSHPHQVKLPHYVFDKLIDGTVQAYGSQKAVRQWQRWCAPVTVDLATVRTQSARKNDRGVQQLRHIRSNRGHQHGSKNLSIKVDSPSDDHPPYSFYNRVLPSVNSVQIIIRGAVAERAAMDREQLSSTEEAYKDLTQWASAALRHLNMDEDDIMGELEVLEKQTMQKPDDSVYTQS